MRWARIVAAMMGTMLVSSCSWLGLPDPTLQSQPATPERPEPVTLQENEEQEDAPSLENGMQPQTPLPKDTKPAEEHPELVQSPTSAPQAESVAPRPTAAPPAAAQPVATTTPSGVPMPSPEQQAAAIKMLQEELATLRAERAAEKAAAAKAATSRADTPPPPATFPEPSRPSAPPAPPVPAYPQQYSPTPAQQLPEPDAAGRRGLRSPSLPKLLPMDIDGKILGTETTL